MNDQNNLNEALIKARQEIQNTESQNRQSEETFHKQELELKSLNEQKQKEIEQLKSEIQESINTLNNLSEALMEAKAAVQNCQSQNKKLEENENTELQFFIKDGLLKELDDFLSNFQKSYFEILFCYQW